MKICLIIYLILKKGLSLKILIKSIIIKIIIKANTKIDRKLKSIACWIFPFNKEETPLVMPSEKQNFLSNKEHIENLWVIETIFIGRTANRIKTKENTTTLYFGYESVKTLDNSFKIPIEHLWTHA